MTRFRMVRLLRTLSSEVYLIWENDTRIGQVDLHFADSSVQANVFLEAELTEEERNLIFQQLDDDIVSSYLPSFERDQFIITVFVGREVDSFNYPLASDEIEEN